MLGLNWLRAATLCSVWAAGGLAGTAVLSADRTHAPSPAAGKALTGRLWVEVVPSREPPGGEGGGQGVDPCEGEVCHRGTLDCGGSAVGSLTPEDCRLLDGSSIEVYRFELERSSLVALTLASQAFDTYVFLVEETSCLVLDENDDCTPGDLQSSCITLELPAGSYFAVANSYSALEEGDYELSVRCMSLFVRGDADSSGVLNITDALRTLNYLFAGGPAPSCLDSADADDDGRLAITDAIVVLSWLFLGGPAPRPPGPGTTVYDESDCGFDPTEDELDCAAAAGTCTS